MNSLLSYLQHRASFPSWSSYCDSSSSLNLLHWLRLRCVLLCTLASSSSASNTSDAVPPFLSGPLRYPKYACTSLQPVLLHLTMQLEWLSFASFLFSLFHSIQCPYGTMLKYAESDYLKLVLIQVLVFAISVNSVAVVSLLSLFFFLWHLLPLVVLMSLGCCCYLN